MVGIKSFSYITACILLLQLSLVNAAPLDEPRALLKRGSSLSGKFLHITDIHLDPFYLEGADPASFCHQHGKKRSKESGKYGALGTKCDSPIPLVQATFEFLKKEIQDVDFIIYTGDTVRHDRDDDLPRTNKDIKDGHEKIMKYFASAYNNKNTPYIPTIGNNDAFDHNDVVKNDTIFKDLQSMWKPLNLNLTGTFTSGGYFVQDIVKDKLSVINLNSMYFFDSNDAVSDCDTSSSPGAVQMKWFENVLKGYQIKGDDHQVYIMSHVPPLDDHGEQLYKSACHNQYLNLLGKYGSVIAGHFNGHTNNDNLNAVVPTGNSYTYIAADDKKADNVKSALNKASVALFNAPSVIPVNNPAIRVYHYDTEGSDRPFGTIRDWDQYYVDLAKANDNGKVEFELEYSASKFYGIKYFDGEGIGKAIMNVSQDKKTRKTYKKYKKVSS